jgi:hypothetical protein
MALPYVDVSSPMLQAYFQGLEQRQRREQNARQNQLQQEQLRLQEEREKRLEKQAMEQFKLQSEAQKLNTQYQQRLLDLRAIDSKRQGLDFMVNNRAVPKPDNRQQQLEEAVFASQGMGDSISGSEYGQPFDFMGHRYSPEELQLADSAVGRVESQEKVQLQRINQQAEAARLRDEAMRAETERKAKADKLHHEAMMARVGAAGSGGSDFMSTLDESVLLSQLRSGELNVRTIGTGKFAMQIMQLAGKHGIYVQPEKFIETSKKLRESRAFLSKVGEVTRAATRTNEEWAALGTSMNKEIGKIAADFRSLHQRIGTLGAQFPALGRLTDHDIKLLRAGMPNPRDFILSKIFPGVGKDYINRINENLIETYAENIQAHLANVPSSEEKNRLIRLYGLYAPGMEKYVRSKSATPAAKPTLRQELEGML